MKKTSEKLKPIFLAVIGYSALGGAILIGDQIHRIHKKVNKATSSDVLSVFKLRPTYIYIEDPFLQEKIQAGFGVGKEAVKLTRFSKWLEAKIEESFIFRSRYYHRKNLPWKLLRVAQDENQTYRIRAIQSLASMYNLTDADYQQLAQACDLRTAVGLARSTNNVKFLLDPPNFKQKPNRNTIIRKLHDFFIDLKSASNHSCLEYFVNKFVWDMSDADKTSFDDDFRMNFDSSDFIQLCLDALLHHSWTDENAKQIINLGGLPILIEIYKLYKQNNGENRDDFVVLSKLLSNLSVCPGSAQSFFKSGCIKILGILSQHEDIRVSAPAQRALLNFDEDDRAHEGKKFPRRIFPLYPTRRTSVRPKVDVIFIHGLLGEIFVTWRQRDYRSCGPKSALELLGITAGIEEVAASYQTTKPLDQDFILDIRDLESWEKVSNSYELVLSDIPVDSNCDCDGPFYASMKDLNCEEKFTKCWPKDWLTKDCPEIRLIGVNYESNLSKWAATCPLSPKSASQVERSRLLTGILVQAGVGSRPVVWVGHSMGGLLVKSVLTLANTSKDPKVRSLLEQTRAVVFYSTPHKGSHLAALNLTSQMIVWPSAEVQELRENAPSLLELHQDFLDLVEKNPIKVISFAERRSTYITALKFELRFVESGSADPDVGESFGIPLDHLSICKPAGRQSFLYQKVRRLISDLVTELRSS